MNEQDKREANDHHIQIYFTAYDRFWRLNKLLLIKKLLLDRNEMTDYFEGFYGKGYFEYEKHIYENVTNGLLADAVSEAVMLCEDYFGILKFIRDRYDFIKRIVNYKAGSVTAIADKLKIVDNEKLRMLFFIPNQEFVQNSFLQDNSDINLFNSRLEMLLSGHNEAVSFYHSKVDAYNSYKHGLKLCLNGLGQDLNPETLNERKASLSGNVFKFDNKPKPTNGLMIPGMGNRAIRNNAAELLEDRNLLHLGLLYGVHIDQLIEIGRNILIAINILVDNRIALINSAGKSTIEVCLPSGNTERLTKVSYQFKDFSGNPIPTIEDYQVKL